MSDLAEVLVAAIVFANVLLFGIGMRTVQDIDPPRPKTKLPRAVLLASLLVGCVERPTAPAVQLITDRAEDVAGVDAWEPLGFDVALEDSGLPECDQQWYAHGELDCQITIGVRHVELLREHVGSNARSFRDQRLIEVDSRLDTFGLLYALSHEAGHILLDTSVHTNGGIMGGSTYVLTPVDRRLACETINICTE